MAIRNRNWHMAAIAAMGLGVAAMAAVMGGRLPVARAAEPAVDGTGARAIRVVAADAVVQSQKRGVCANQLSAEDIRALAPGVSWWYSWHYKTDDLTPAGVKFEFVPMAWGDRPEDLAGLEAYLKAGNRPRFVLAINEPNLKGQAFIPPEQTANFYKKVKGIADKYNIPVQGPQMALGSATGDSITAMDPIEKKQVTYTFMVPFMKAFDHYMGNVKWNSVGVHSYGDIYEMRWAVGEMHKQFNKPVYMTEYAQWNAANDEAELLYLVQSTDFLERTDFVDGYCWFKERVDANKKISLLDGSGQLTTIGKAYVSLPVHDADLYYRMPGRLAAGRYVQMNAAEIYPTTDGEGGFDMASTGRDGWIAYNVQVDTAGEYVLKIRVRGGGGAIEVMQGGKSIASAKPTQKDWQTIETKVSLKAGPQQLRLNYGSNNRYFHWLELAAK